MDWLRKLFQRQWQKGTAEGDALPVPAAAPDIFDLSHDRLVVVDVETTGLSLQRDSLISIGAVAIAQGRIQLADQFEVTLRTNPGRRLLRSVLIHGLSPENLAAGAEPRDALSAFLDYVRDAPLFAYHARFDQHMLGKATSQYLDMNWQADFTDVAEVAAWLSPNRKESASLDDWLQHYRLDVSARHSAAADALATAELMLVLMRQLRARNVLTLGDLREKLRLGRKLQLHRI